MIVPEQTYSAGPWWARVRVRLLWWTFWRPWRTPVMRSNACGRWRTPGGATSPSRRPHPDIHPGDRRWSPGQDTPPSLRVATGTARRNVPVMTHDMRIDGPMMVGVSRVGRQVWCTFVGGFHNPSPRYSASWQWLSGRGPASSTPAVPRRHDRVEGLRDRTTGL